MKKIMGCLALLILFGSVVLYGQNLNSEGRKFSDIPKSILPQNNTMPTLLQPVSSWNRDGIGTEKDAIVADDQLVTGSLGVGFSTYDGMSFGFNTIVLYEDNVRINFDDASTAVGFPNNDWTLLANDTQSGGANYFAIQDATAAVVPFKIMAGAPANALYVGANGNIGLKTNNPMKELQLAGSNTPALRLEQTNGGGYNPYTWDVAGNEANFFIRDVTAGNLLPFRIKPGAPNNSIYISASGNIGLGTASPDENLYVTGNIKTDSLLKIAPLGSLPDVPAEGDICMDGTDHALKYFDGTIWKVPEANTDEQDLANATLTGTILEIDIENGASVSVDLAPLLEGLQDQIDALEARVTALEGATAISSIPDDGAKLFQSIPNPANKSLLIPYIVPSAGSIAKIVVFNSNGTTYKEYSLKERDKKAYLSLSDKELKVGIYLYSLIVDGKQLDTKSLSIVN
jgi:hypothetical protein